MIILVINPGSTSTKLAIYDDEKQIWAMGGHHALHDLEHFHHVNDQFIYRYNFIDKLLKSSIPDIKIDAIIARGGLLKPTPGGVYEINEKIKHDLLHAKMEHACNLGALLADKLAYKYECPAFIADPEVVDEMCEEARLTGIAEIKRHSIFHALNSKAVSRKYASSIKKKYEDLNLIVAHLGGGISVGAHRKGRVIDVNNALNGDGPFTPERAGTIPADQLVELCFSGKYSQREIKRMLNGKGGLISLLGTNNVIKIVEKAENGEEPYHTVLSSMIYGIAKEIGAMYVVLGGKADAIILTGGIANSKYIVSELSKKTSYLAPIVVIPGEDEMSSLAYNALGVLRKEFDLQEYNPKEE